MANITIYVPREIHEALKLRPDINRSKIVAAALKKALQKEKKS